MAEGMQKKIALLGSTGSIGTQALDVISGQPGRFEVEVLTAGNNVRLLSRQALKYNPETVVIGNKEHYQKLRESLRHTRVKVYAGEEEIERVASECRAGLVIAAMVGFSGLKPTLAAVKAGKKIALANKETLVVAGEIICRLAKQSGCQIIPVDSEHSAIFQCLVGEPPGSVEKITLTASGGPFLDYTTEMLREIKPHEALRHPNWDMGNKVTIDSASLMNKGLEVIEAKWLFSLEPEMIEVIIHPQSIIHSLVHFRDGSVKAQMGLPDMRVPILYALSYPDRLTSELPRLELNKHSSLTFTEPDTTRFRNLSLAYEALKSGGNTPCVLNSANETAVIAFLAGKIGFLQISEVVEYAMSQVDYMPSPGLGYLETTHNEAREISLDYINKLSK